MLTPFVSLDPNPSGNANPNPGNYIIAVGASASSGYLIQVCTLPQCDRFALLHSQNNCCNSVIGKW
jgi:hypothetical protein